MKAIKLVPARKIGSADFQIIVSYIPTKKMSAVISIVVHVKPGDGMSLTRALH